MAAGTQYLDSANSKSFMRLLKKENNYRQNIRFDPAGFFAFDSGAQTVATTNTETIADELFVLKFPDNTYIYDLQVTVTDLDSDGTPTLELDHIVENSAGTETILINGSGSTIAEAGGSDDMDRGAGNMFKDVSNQYLGFKVRTAAATPAAGTVRYKGIIYIGAPLTGF